jgi:hypothetical protein
MLNYTLAYMDKIENLMLFNKNNFDKTGNILLVAENEDLSSSIEFIFTSDETDKKIRNFLTAIASLAIATHPFDSLIKKKLLLKRFLSKSKKTCNGKIDFAKIKNKNLVVFSYESWFVLLDENEEVGINKQKAFITYAFEKESGNFISTMSKINLGENGFAIKEKEYIEMKGLFKFFDSIYFLYDPSLREYSFKILNDVDFPKKLKDSILH